VSVVYGAKVKIIFVSSSPLGLKLFFHHHFHHQLLKETGKSTLRK